MSLSYQELVVVIGDLTLESDPTLLDLCREHAAGLTPPRGWTLRDERAPASAPAM